MTMQTPERSIPADLKKRTLQTIGIFAGLILVSGALVTFGGRSDADAVAKALKTGILTADVVDVAFEGVSGRLIRRVADEADRVESGSELLALDPTDTAIALERLEAVLSQERASLEEAKAAKEIAVHAANLAETTAWRTIEELLAAERSSQAALAFAESEWKRASGLYKTGGVSQSDCDQARTNLTDARNTLIRAQKALHSAAIGATEEETARLRRTGSADGMTLAEIANQRMEIKNRDNAIAALEAGIRQSEADLAQLRVNEKRLTLRAPESGKIIAVNYQPGDWVNAGASAVRIETNRRYFDFYVSETLVPLFQEGSEVEAWAPALGETVKGTVRIAAAAPSFADLRTTREQGQADLTSFKIRVYTEPNDRLLTGMTLEVRMPDAGKNPQSGFSLKRIFSGLPL